MACSRFNSLRLEPDGGLSCAAEAAAHASNRVNSARSPSSGAPTLVWSNGTTTCFAQFGELTPRVHPAPAQSAAQEIVQPLTRVNLREFVPLPATQSMFAELEARRLVLRVRAVRQSVEASVARQRLCVSGRGRDLQASGSNSAPLTFPPTKARSLHTGGCSKSPPERG